MYYKGYVLSEYYDDIIVSKLRKESPETFTSYDLAKTFIDNHKTVPMPFLISSFQIAYWVAIALGVALKLMKYEFAEAGNGIIKVFTVTMAVWVVLQLLADILSFGKSGKDKKKKFLNRHCMDCDFKDFIKIVFSELYVNIFSVILGLVALMIF